MANPEIRDIILHIRFAAILFILRNQIGPATNVTDAFGRPQISIKKDGLSGIVSPGPIKRLVGKLKIIVLILN